MVLFDLNILILLVRNRYWWPICNHYRWKLLFICIRYRWLLTGTSCRNWVTSFNQWTKGNIMEFVQGKDSFNEMATGIWWNCLRTIRLTHLSIFQTSAGSPEETELRLTCCATHPCLSDMGYTEIISSTDMDTAAKLTPRGLNSTSTAGTVQAMQLLTFSKEQQVRPALR